ncbi:MAG: DUF1080 domain-containing protein [Gemmataceae bacterium]
MRLSLAILFLVIGHSRADTPPEVVLFDGKTLDGWTVEGPAEATVDGQKTPVWFVRDGKLVTANRVFGFLRYSKRDFSDFELVMEYRIAPKTERESSAGNSGVGIRTGPFDPKKSSQTRPSYFAYEIQIIDDAGKPASKTSTASLYRYVAPSKNANRPAGEWNTLVVNCVGPHITITLNGDKVIDVDQTTIEAIKSKPLKGSICLQSHGPNREVEFRNLRVREIAPAATKDKP